MIGNARIFGKVPAAAPLLRMVLPRHLRGKWPRCGDKSYDWSDEMTPG
jgi:hypothetical protein